jgi:integrase
MPGSIEWRSHNTCRIRISRGYPNGKRKWYSETKKYPSTMTRAAMDRQAELDKALFVAKVERGEVVEDSNTRLEDFAKDWIADHKGNWSLYTAAHYQDLLNSRILPAMGHMKLSKITPSTIQRFYRDLQKPGARKDGIKDRGLSGKTIHEYDVILSGIFKHALRFQLVATNPMDRVVPPKISTPEMAYYTPEQARVMLAALDAASLSHRAGVCLALFGGLRLSEIAGLEWKHLDFERNCVHIQQASKYVPGEGVITKEPKTNSGRRTVDLPPAIMDLLKAHRVEQAQQRLAMGPLWTDTGRVFTQDNGKAAFPDSLSQWWRKFLKQNDLPHIRFHDIRHTCATLLLAHGIDMKTVSVRMGHSKVSTTMDIYAHALESKNRESADRLQDILLTDKA